MRLWDVGLLPGRGSQQDVYEDLHVEDAPLPAYKPIRKGQEPQEDRNASFDIRLQQLHYQKHEQHEHVIHSKAV